MTLEDSLVLLRKNQVVVSNHLSILTMRNGQTWKQKMENINLVLRECHNLKRQIVVKNNRMVETRISQKEVERIHQYNLTVQNQLGAMCTYCGEEIRDDCHCHEFNCKTCEPQNFCSTCHVIVVCPVI